MEQRSTNRILANLQTRPAAWKRQLVACGFTPLPALLTRASPAVVRRIVEFFACRLRNRHTRVAYAHAVARFFDALANRRVHDLHRIRPTMVAAYIDELEQVLARPSVKQHLAAVRMLFDWLLMGGVLPKSPAAAVRGPKFVAVRGKTPVLNAPEARQLLDAIDTSQVVGLRDRALIAVMLFGFARVSAVIGMKVADYYVDGWEWWFRLHEKGGTRHVVPVHHQAKLYIDRYLEVAGIAKEGHTPLFRATRGQTRVLTSRPLTRTDVLRMVKRRARDAALHAPVSCHAFRATAITLYLMAGGTIDHAQAFAAHANARTTRLYDRRHDKLTPEEIERIAI